MFCLICFLFWVQKNTEADGFRVWFSVVFQIARTTEDTLKTGGVSSLAKMKEEKEEKEYAVGVGQDVVLYDRLMTICSHKMVQQTNYIKESLDQLMKIKSEKENLDKVVNYKDFIICVFLSTNLFKEMT